MKRTIRFVSTISSLLLVTLILVAKPAITSPVTKNPISIEVTTHLGDKQTFKQGDIIAFLISLDRDAHILMIYQDAQQNLVQIIPNSYRQQDFYQAGLFIAVPDQNEPFEFTVNPPYGEEKLWVFASNKKFPELQGTDLSNGLRQLKQNLSEVLSIVRPKNPNVAYGESNTTIVTESN